jgi:hypothetical protein
MDKKEKKNWFFIVQDCLEGFEEIEKGLDGFEKTIV